MYKPFIWQCFRFILVIAGMTLLYLTGKFMIVMFYPFIIALIITTMIHPLVSLLEKRAKLSRGFATFIVIFGCVSILFGVLMFIISEVIEGTVYLADKLPTYFEEIVNFFQQFINLKVIPFYQDIISWIQTLGSYEQFTIQEHVQIMTNHFATIGATFLRHLLLMIPKVLVAFPQSLTVFIFIIIATFIMTKDWLKLKRIVFNYIPSSLFRAGRNVIHHLEQSVFGFLKAQLIIISISSIIIFIGLCILQIEHALTISLLIGLVDLLPLLGTGIVFLPWIGYLYITNHYTLTIGLIIIYMIVIITRQIAEPQILSTHVGINPLVSLMILFISFQLWGLTGILIAPLLLIVISAFYRAGIMKQLTIFIKGNTIFDK